MGRVAQLVEQWTENPCVGGSIPPPTTLAIGTPQNGLFRAFFHDTGHLGPPQVRYSDSVATTATIAPRLILRLGRMQFRDPGCPLPLWKVAHDLPIGENPTTRRNAQAANLLSYPARSA